VLDERTESERRMRRRIRRRRTRGKQFRRLGRWTIMMALLLLTVRYARQRAVTPDVLMTLGGLAALGVIVLAFGLREALLNTRDIRRLRRIDDTIVEPPGSGARPILEGIDDDLDDDDLLSRSYRDAVEHASPDDFRHFGAALEKRRRRF